MQNQNRDSKNNRLRIGITHGDINGIGYEVIIKTLSDNRILEFFTPIVYGHSKVASFYKKHLNNPDINFNLVKDASQAHPKRVNIVNCTEDDLHIEMGQSTSVAGKAAFAALEMAVHDLKNDLLDAVVTAPINKNNIQSDAFHFPGHTEYFSASFGNEEPLMLMVWNDLRVGTLTGHLPLKNVSSAISTSLIQQKLAIFSRSLEMDFGISKPKIAVLGLNPHAGDGGVLGSEETEVIAPALASAKKDGILAFGPFAADGFFGSGSWKKYDGVLAMYHDQGLAPFKSIAAGEGVNFTAGLSIIRTSPAHGTAYEISGQNMATEESFRQAIYLALDVATQRREYEADRANPL